MSRGTALLENIHGFIQKYILMLSLSTGERGYCAETALSMSNTQHRQS